MKTAYFAATIFVCDIGMLCAQVVPPSTASYTNVALNPSVAEVGADYRGFDPAAIYDSVATLVAGLPKSTFETAEEYQRRQAGLAQADIMPGVPLSTTLSILLNENATNKEIDQVGFSYDADFQTLIVKVSPEHRRFLLPTGGNLAVLKVKLTQKQLGHYTGENGFGATAEVDRLEDSTYSVGFEPNSWLDGASIFVKMDRQEAERLYPNLGVLLLCRLLDPWIVEHVEHHPPTVAEAYDSYWVDKYLNVMPVEVWVYDRQSGKVLAKVSRENISEGRAAYERRRQERFPVRLEVSSECEGSAFIRYKVDGGAGQSGEFAPGLGLNIVKLPVMLEAEEKIELWADFGYTGAHLLFKLNGQAVQPEWRNASGKLIRPKQVRSPAGPCYAPVPRYGSSEVTFQASQAKF